MGELRLQNNLTQAKNYPPFAHPVHQQANSQWDSSGCTEDNEGCLVVPGVQSAGFGAIGGVGLPDMGEEVRFLFLSCG